MAACMATRSGVEGPEGFVDAEALGDHAHGRCVLGRELAADPTYGAAPTSDYALAHNAKRPSQQGLFFEPTPGLEPGTPSLRVKCSTS
jgi:hypothetical protein